jgi:DNA-binding response OmpR family regulator
LILQVLEDKTCLDEEATMACIILIEDSNNFRGILKKALEYEGHEVLDAQDGKYGERLYREGHADLVITDILMPEKDGLEIIIELRRDFPDIKILAISGGGRIGSEQYLDTAKLLGAQDILGKPFKQKDLLESVRKLLKQP